MPEKDVHEIGRARLKALLQDRFKLLGADTWYLRLLRNFGCRLPPPHFMQYKQYFLLAAPQFILQWWLTYSLILPPCIPNLSWWVPLAVGSAVGTVLAGLLAGALSLVAAIERWRFRLPKTWEEFCLIR